MTVAVQLPIDYGVFSNSMDVLVVADSSLDTGLPLLYKTIRIDWGSASSLETSNNAPPWYPFISHTHPPPRLFSSHIVLRTVRINMFMRSRMVRCEK